MNEQELIDRIWGIGPYLLHYALKWTDSKEDAEDVITQTQIRAIKYKHSFTPRKDADRDFKAWIRCVCYSRAVNMYHENKKRRFLEGICAGGKGIEGYGSVEVDSGFDGELVRRAISNLKPYFAELIIMFYFEGLTYTEMSNRLCTPMGTVMSRLYRARKVLAKDPLILQALGGLDA